MIDRGVPKVLEFNVRFGDPETSVLVPTYGGDWFELLHGAASGRAPVTAAPLAPVSALSIVMAAEGYPARPRTGDRIEGLDQALPPGAFILHAGTARSPDGAVVTAGGRVLAVGASAPTLDAAARIAYQVAGGIRWAGEHHRSDIGRRGGVRAT
jgi:phosphoribosylamine--glycine ligase